MEPNGTLHHPKTGSWAGVSGRHSGWSLLTKTPGRRWKEHWLDQAKETQEVKPCDTHQQACASPRPTKSCLSATQIQTWSEAPLSSHLGRTPSPCVGLRSLFLFLQGPTAAFTHHWGSEKGGTSRQVCKEGGKLVFSQGSSHRKGAQASCLNQNWFRNHSDVWFVRKRVERGVLFVSGNCDFLLARRGHGRKAEGQACKHQWPPCLRLELFDLKTKNIYYQLVGLRHPGIHLFITGYHENGKMQWKQFASCLRQLCFNRLYPFGTL